MDLIISYIFYFNKVGYMVESNTTANVISIILQIINLMY